jgi:hypothetical protein
MTDDIAAIFCKDPKEWTSDDVDRVVAKYQEYVACMRERGFFKSFDPKTGEPKPKRVRRKVKVVDPNQLDLFAKETP